MVLDAGDLFGELRGIPAIELELFVEERDREIGPAGIDIGDGERVFDLQPRQFVARVAARRSLDGARQHLDRFLPPRLAHIELTELEVGLGRVDGAAPVARIQSRQRLLEQGLRVVVPPLVHQHARLVGLEAGEFARRDPEAPPEPDRLIQRLFGAGPVAGLLGVHRPLQLASIVVEQTGLRRGRNGPLAECRRRRKWPGKRRAGAGKGREQRCEDDECSPSHGFDVPMQNPR